MSVEKTRRNIGRRVQRARSGREGVIVRYDPNYIYVRYDGDTHSCAANPDDLDLIEQGGDQ